MHLIFILVASFDWWWQVGQSLSWLGSAKASGGRKLLPERLNLGAMWFAPGGISSDFGIQSYSISKLLWVSSYVGWLFGGCKFPSRLDPQSIFDSADDLLRAKTFGDDHRNTILLLVPPPPFVSCWPICWLVGCTLKVCCTDFSDSSDSDLKLFLSKVMSRRKHPHMYN